MALDGKTYEEIRDQCLRDNKLFEDPDFPAEDRSIYYSRAPPRRFVWKRPKEICSDPQFFVGGALRFDVNQGMLGNCWFLAAVSSLTLEPYLLARVVPQDQDFKDKYAGIFRFRFWQYGNWIDIVVDDRLPTYNNKPAFMHSADDNEFWSALLEKAYAKLTGSYESLKGGQTSEAMTDLTGGISEAFDTTKEDSEELQQIMLKAIRRGSLMSCSIDGDPSQTEVQRPDGLVIRKAYSVTAVTIMDIKTNRIQRKIPMVRVRNPWGNESEWNGAWSDKSREWQFVPDDEKRDIGLTFEDDGEFWMSFEDFSTKFSQVEICNLGPEVLESERSTAILNWESSTFNGSWQRRVSAGGCRNFLDTFWTNPQYRVDVIDADDDDDQKGTLIVALMQKNRREGREKGLDNLTIGYSIYKVENEIDGTLDLTFFKHHQSADRSPEYKDAREVIGRHKLTPGKYCIVPTAFNPGEEGDFMLRVFSEKPIGARELGDATEMYDPKSNEVTRADEELNQKQLEKFYRLAGVDEEIDAYELREILNASFKRDFNLDGISVDISRSIIIKMTNGRSSKLGPREFMDMLNELREVKSIFEKYDADSNNSMNSYELRPALQKCGFRLSNSTFASLTMWYTKKEGKICFDDFLHCIFRLKRLFGLFNDAKTGSRADFSLDEFLQSMIYL